MSRKRLAVLALVVVAVARFLRGSDTEEEPA
jgi:hypothetical protein